MSSSITTGHPLLCSVSGRRDLSPPCGSNLISAPSPSLADHQSVIVNIVAGRLGHGEEPDLADHRPLHQFFTKLAAFHLTGTEDGLPRTGGKRHQQLPTILRAVVAAAFRER